MYSPQCGGRRGGRISFLRQISFILFSCSLAGAQSSQSVQTPVGADCSDPLLAGTAVCSSQSLQQSAPQQMPTGMQGTSTIPVVNPSSNYSDIEQYSRQAAAQPAPLPPEPLTEFQKFVASSAGLILPVYGADLFRRIPSTFAPVDMAPVPLDYVIGPGDELRIRVWGQVSIQANVRVDRSGEVYLPQVGQVHVA